MMFSISKVRQRAGEKVSSRVRGGGLPAKVFCSCGNVEALTLPVQTEPCGLVRGTGAHALSPKELLHVGLHPTVGWGN